jgi:hypothetical protein
MFSCVWSPDGKRLAAVQGPISSDVVMISNFWGRDQACPNYDRLAEARLAAAPLAVRKGSAFPGREKTNQPPPRRPDSVYRGGAEEEKTGRLGRKGAAFPHSGAAEPHGVPRFPANLDSRAWPCAPTKRRLAAAIQGACGAVKRCVADGPAPTPTKLTHCSFHSAIFAM